MKVILTSTGDSLESEIDPRLGRCKFFILFDTDDDSFSVIDNKQNMELPSGAGVQAAHNIISSKADAVITPNCGPKAFRALSAAGIKIYSCEVRKVGDIIKDFKADKLEQVENPNVSGHWV